jgi:hypothetical protein
MRTVALIALAAVGLSACTPPYVRAGAKALKPISRLDCPASHGALNRISAAADGSACTYSSSDGASVQLKLVRFSGDPETLLQPMEAQLKSELPPAAPESAAPASAATPAGRDQVDIRVPGVSIQAGDQGARVLVPGVHVDADDRHGSVHVTGQSPHDFGGPPGRGQFSVDANDRGAVIHARSFGPNLNESLILVSNTPGPQGWRTVGYEALGPRSGPLVVATVQSKSDEHEGLFADVKSLVRKVARS